MIRTALALALVAFALPASPAQARDLTKQDARAGAERFMAATAWAFDTAQSGEKVHVRPPRFCKRVSQVTVECPVVLRLVSTPTVLRGRLRVHRTGQGLLGYRLPWDPYEIAATLGKSASL